MNEDKKKYIDLVLNEPVKIGHWLGFNKLTDLHDEWIKSYTIGREDRTILAHRGSYKTTSLSIAMAIRIVLFPEKNMIFMRKTDTDIIEIINQVRKMLETDVFAHLVNKIYGMQLILDKATSSEINTNLNSTSKGTSQLIGIGVNGSLTGK